MPEKEAVRFRTEFICLSLGGWDERRTNHRSDDMADAFITLEQAGVLLGGTERPFSRYTTHYWGIFGVIFPRN